MAHPSEIRKSEVTFAAASSAVKRGRLTEVGRMFGRVARAVFVDLPVITFLALYGGATFSFAGPLGTIAGTIGGALLAYRLTSGRKFRYGLKVVRNRDEDEAVVIR